jgi:hypothetical protein
LTFHQFLANPSLVITPVALVGAWRQQLDILVTGLEASAAQVSFGQGPTKF